VRAHWRIENSLHGVLDVSLDEDRARNRRDHGPENLAILRKLALNVLPSARPDISIRRKRKRSGWSDDFARPILGQMRWPWPAPRPRLRLQGIWSSRSDAVARGDRRLPKAPGSGGR
jgi:hypothetical protein